MIVTPALLGSLALVAIWYCCRWYALSRPLTTAVFKLSNRVSDENIPGTLNVGHALPTLVQAAIVIVTVSVDTMTLISMTIAAIVGAWLGAGIVSRLPRQGVQLGMGAALLCAALVLIASNLQWMPPTASTDCVINRIE